MNRPVLAMLAMLVSGASSPGAIAADASLAALGDRFFDRFLELNPVGATIIGEHRYDNRLTVPDAAYVASTRALRQETLDALARVDRKRLAGEDVLSAQVLEYDQRIALESLSFPGRLMPFDQMQGAPTFFAEMGAGDGVQPFATVKDYQNFAARMAAWPRLVDTLVALMREGVKDGIVQPRVVMERALPQIETLAKGPVEATVFWKPVEALPAGFAAADRDRITKEYREAIDQSVLPAYARLRDFVRDEYLPKTRASVGLSALPGGDRWYAFLARANTTTDTPVEELHQIGLAEVARIDGEIAVVMRRIGFEGTVGELAESMRQDPRFRFHDAAEILAAYRGLESRVNAAVPRLFSLVPKTPLEIRELQPFRAEAHAQAEYFSPSEDGTRPGIFYVNTFDLPSRPSYSIETVYVHEAIPGHHFQIALAIENTSLPRFRRFESSDSLGYAPDITTAYTEGWGLYAESLGDELGLYTDPYRKLGNLFAESWRAVRLVVDTGMHAKGWTRERSIDYILAHTALGRTDAVAEIERYIAWPGQALAYKTGQMTIRRLRTRAEQELGAKFDVRAFHAQVLGSGPLPLSVLEAKINRWIESNR